MERERNFSRVIRKFEKMRAQEIGSLYVTLRYFKYQYLFFLLQIVLPFLALLD